MSCSTLQLGIDLSDPDKVEMVRRITLEYHGRKARDLRVEPEDLVQQVLMAILVRNRGKCPYKPLEGYTEKPYVYRVAWQTLSRMVDKRARWYDIELHSEHKSLCAVAHRQGAFDEDDPMAALAGGQGHLWETRMAKRRVRRTDDKPSSEQTFRKDDGGKPRFDLVDPLSQLSLAKVLTIGADRYGARNYLNQGVTMARYEAAMLRHVNAYMRGEFIDPDSGEPHLAHVMANSQILMELRREVERQGKAA